MSLLTVALEQMLLAKIANSGMIGNKSKVRFSPWTVSALLAFVGICFLIAAAYIWMLNNYSADIATAAVGVLIIALGILIGLAAWGIHEYKMSRIVHYKDEFTSVLHSLGGHLVDELEDPIRENPRMAVALAVIAGFFISRNIL